MNCVIKLSHTVPGRFDRIWRQNSGTFDLPRPSFLLVQKSLNQKSGAALQGSVTGTGSFDAGLGQTLLMNMKINKASL